MPRYISPAQVKQLIIGASKIWKDQGLAAVAHCSFDDWRGSVCETVTGQTSFRKATIDQFPALAKAFGVDAATGWRGRGGKKSGFNKGQYYLRKVIEEHRLTEEYVSAVCNSIFGDDNWRQLSENDAKKLGHILQRKTKPGGDAVGAH